MDRRGFVLGAGAVGMALGAASGTAYTQIASRADHSLRIAPLRLELAPGKVIDTFAYNGTVPGPALRLREGSPVSIDIRNDTDVDDIVHWHGLYLPSQSDGAMEEGSPMVPRGGTQRYGFVAKTCRHPVVPQSQHGRDGSEQKPVRGPVRFPARRAAERSRPL
jgi:FtsP/CotA-like multicopper oxidase with cupredoxin domain